MKKINLFIIILTGIIMITSCSNSPKSKSTGSYEKGTFGYDLTYLSQKDDRLIVLTGNEDKAQVIVSAKYQAKVFTSTANGPEGNSLGFVNYKVFGENVIDEHMNGYGGENRFWLGPEGGRYSVFFKPGTEQVFDNWHTPKPVDIEPWDVVASNPKSVTMKKEMEVSNFAGSRLRLNVDRKITLIEPAEATRLLDITVEPSLNLVAYQTENTITNLNDFEWTTETGTICIWILDMFNPAPKAVTFIPFNEGEEAVMGKIVTSDYFGEVPADRLKIQENIIYLKTDGNYRSKLGLNAKRAKTIAGNYDPDSKRLTITTFDVDKGAVYLNQEWNPDKNPLTGDAMNAYNDGPLEDGSIMGPFLELESASPAAFLKPAQSLTHRHNVFHFVGEEKDLNPMVEKLFGISIRDIKNVFSNI